LFIQIKSLAQLLRILKFVVILIICGLLYYQVAHGKGYEALISSWESQSIYWDFRFLILSIMLMPANWFLESKKWQILMSPHVALSLNDALKTVLSGIALGIATPARIGEYGGRLLTSDPNHKPQVISATLLGSIAQNLCNVVMGLVFSYYFLKSIFNVTYSDHIAFSIAVGLQIGILIFIYYKLPKVAKFVERFLKWKYFLKISSKLKSLDLYTVPLLNKIILISLLRYSIYFIQYLLILKFLGVQNDFLELSGGIASIYLIQTGIPLPAFLSILARGELAILVWSSLGIVELTALVATFILWFVNLIFPSLVGLMILTRFDVKAYFKK
jgi:hypothetical protein